MKKIIVAILIVLLLCGCGGESTQEYVSKNLDIDLRKAEIISEADSHGGFHGDGEMLVALNVGDISTSLEAEGPWQPLPRPEKLKNLTDGIPEVENGYWYFYDRHYKATDCYDVEAVDSRFSYNFTFAVYDAEAGIIYYFEFDT